MPLPLTNLSKSQLQEWVTEELAEPKFRATQILQWIYQRRVQQVSEMTNLSAKLRSRLEEEGHQIRTLSVAKVQGSADTTQKFLYRLGDGRFIEAVLIPANPALYGEASTRRTLCVSSQVGCAYDCKFCASGLAGFTRNLTTGEIVEQVLLAEDHSGERVDNLVFMGMGEPLANLT
ncbi:MAG: 23S rRNA (adenine(2503)-C(2))-methyltransferase RlmN, partial [Verrucomicrobiota bacterium]